MSDSSSRSPFLVVLSILLFLGIALQGFFSYQQFVLTRALLSKDRSTFSSFIPDTERHYAVFLNDGQVYFAKIKDTSSDLFYLEDIYYFQGQTSLSAEEGISSDLQLIKLGSELHDPEDKMYIPRSYIRFFEPLKSDSRVIQAIKEFRSQAL